MYIWIIQFHIPIIKFDKKKYLKSQFELAGTALDLLIYEHTNLANINNLIKRSQLAVTMNAVSTLWMLCNTFPVQLLE